MALFENIAEAIGESIGGVAAGVGAVIAAPLILPVLRPVAKEAIKGGLYISDKTKVVVAEAGEQLGDLVAEARSEMNQAAGE